MKKRIFFIAATAVTVCPLSAATWGNLTPNGSLGSGGYVLSSGGNWVGGTAPTFNNQAQLQFTGFTGATATTISGGVGTTTMNRITVNTDSQLRLISGSSVFSFQGTDPTIDVERGTLRLEVQLSSGVAGITKTGAGTIFSNLQSVSSGFTGPFTIAQGLVTSGNNFALGDQKVVNVLSGGSVNMNGQLWGSSNIVSGTTVSRNYTFNIAGTGTSGQGAITNGSTSVNVLTGISGIFNLNLDAAASIGGSGNFSIGHGGSINGNGHTLTKTGSNQIYVSGAASNISYQVDQGTLVGYNHDSAFGGVAGSVSVNGGAILASHGNRTFANSITFADAAVLDNLSGSATWSGDVGLADGNVVVRGTASGNAITMSGLISGGGGIRKEGFNTLTISNSNSYTGITNITQGQIRLGAGGSISQSPEIRISTGASYHVSDVSGGYLLDAEQLLSGGGTVIGNTTIAGTHTPGFSPGIQTFQNDLSYTTGSQLVWELIDNTISGRGTNYDGVNVGGNLAFIGDVVITLDFATASLVDWSSSFWDNYYTGTNGWKILDVDGTVSGMENVELASTLQDSNGVTLNSVRKGAYFSLFQGADGVYLNYAIPEPSTALLGGLGALALLRRRRNLA